MIKYDIKIKLFQQTSATVTTKEFSCLKSCKEWAELQTRHDTMPQISIYEDGEEVATQGYLVKGTSRFWLTLDGYEYSL
jgi:hypothetical protein